jgi:hypothetical protein
MSKTLINTAFEEVCDKIRQLVQLLKEEATNAIRESDYEAVGYAVDQVKRLEGISEDIKQMQEKWMEPPVREIDFDIPWLEPPVMEGEEKETNQPPPVPRERSTARSAFRLPILEALDELGGAAPSRAVLEKVKLKLSSQFTEADLEVLPSGGRRRWKENAEWCRYEMVREGLLASDSPRGIWQITEKGRVELANLRAQRGGT